MSRSEEKKNSSPVADNWCCTLARDVRFTYTWLIEQFRVHSLRVKTGERIESTTFSATSEDTNIWRLELYPQGLSKESKNYISIFLRLCSSKRLRVWANYKVSIINDKGQEIRSNGGESEFEQGGDWGFKDYIRRDYLLTDANGLLPNDKLTILCEVIVGEESINISGKSNRELALAAEVSVTEDLGRLLEQQKLTDVTVSAGSREMRAHRAVLAARSSVLADFFERGGNRVELKDTSAEVMEEVLHFIYTGRVGDLQSHAKDLLKMANTYELEDLKRMCEDELSLRLSVDNAADSLVLADKYRAPRLKARSIAFINTHAAAVVNTPGWLTLYSTHPHLLAQAWLAIMSSDQPCN